MKFNFQTVKNNLSFAESQPAPTPTPPARPNPSPLDRFYFQCLQGLDWHLQYAAKLRPGVEYTFLNAEDNPKILRVVMHLSPAQFKKVKSAANELAMAAGLQPGATIRVARAEGGMVALEIPKPESLCFNLTVQALPSRAGRRIYVGIGQNRRPIPLDFQRPDSAHLLIAGATGMGKTNTGSLILRNLIRHNDPDEVQLLLFDVEKAGRDWHIFERVPHLLHPPIYDYASSMRAITWLIVEAERRRTERLAKPDIFVVVDEWQDMADNDPLFVSNVARLARLGRSFGLHIVLLVQNPTVENVGHNDIVRNILYRLVARVADSTAARVATGQSDSGAHLLSSGGDELLVQPGHPVERIAVPLVKPGDVADLPRAERQAHLPLDEFEDPARVESIDWPELEAGQVLLGGGKAEPVSISQLAYAVATDSGVLKLSREFGVGAAKGGKAYRLREAAQQMRGEIEGLGYEIRKRE